MYRIVFFKIPFMRGGYRVPACPFGDKPITHMAAYKVAEVVTDLAFAETQRGIIVDGDTATAADDGMANYAYIAQTNNSTIGNYANDLRPAYYWVDDLQFVGVAGNDTPAAVVTISPDVWLTDFFSSQPIVRGRLAQSTVLFGGSPRTPLVAPVFDQRFNYQANALTGGGFWVVGVFTDARGGIQAYAVDASSMATAEQWAQTMGGAAKITITVPSAPAEDIEISCARVYIIPDDFATTTDGDSIVNTSTATGYEITSANDVKINVYPFATLGGVGLKRVHDVTVPAAGNFRDLNSKAWICTPARFVELNEMRGISWDGATPLAASFFMSASSGGDDGIKIYMQVGSEFIDVSDDFVADFATNTQAVQQAQQKQLIALQAITGVIGAAGGAVGGLASGNYFGAVQSIAGGVETVAGLGQAKRAPAQMRGNGGVAAFYGFTNTLILLLSLGTPANSDEISAVEAEYGWQYDNAPYMDFNAGGLELDAYYRFADVAVSNMTGGQGAQQEVANALATGVRFVDIS